MATRVCWTPYGAFVFTVDDIGTALFSDTGQVTWTRPSAVIGAFTPGGQALVTVSESSIEAWFVTALAPRNLVVC